MWNETTITNAGLAVYNRWLGGEALTLTAAKGGDVVAADPAAATDLVRTVQTLTILGTEAVNGGHRVRVQVTSAGLSAGYTLRQVGIWGRIGSEMPVLLILLQDADGVPVPAAADNPDFVCTLGAFFQAVSAGRFSATIDPRALVSRETMTAAVSAHNTSATAHQDIRLQLTSPFNFKGDVADLTALEAIQNPAQNDTYYVTSLMCRYSWTGSAWAQSSLGESEYEDELSDVKNALTKASTMTELNNATWSVGAITTDTGVNLANTHRLRSNSMTITDALIRFQAKPGYEFLLFAYDSSNAYVGCMRTDGTYKKTTGDNDYFWTNSIFLEAAYPYKLRIVMRNATDPSATMTTEESSNLMYIKRLVDDTLSLQDVPADSYQTGLIRDNVDILQGFMFGGDIGAYTSLDTFVWVDERNINTSGTVVVDQNVILSKGFLSVDDYAIDGALQILDRSKNNGFFFAIAFFTSEQAFISPRIGFLSGETSYVVNVPDNAAYFRVAVVYKINNVAVAGHPDNMPLDKAYLGLLQEDYDGVYFDMLVSQAKLAQIYGNPDVMDIMPDIVSAMSTPGQGLSKVGDRYLISRAGSASYDSAGSNATIQVYDSSFANVGHMIHNLGHGSGLSYNETYDVFLMGNGEANVSPRLDILLNASDSVISAVDGSIPEYLFGGSNVMSIFLEKDGTPLLPDADGATWCMGGNSRLVFISLRDADKNRVFYLAMLGVGSTDFSLLDTGYGTFISGKTDSELNGTIKILHKYERMGDGINSAQGMQYDKGKLIVTSSVSNCMIYRIGFYDTGYKILDAYKCSFFDGDGTELVCEPEGIVTVATGEFYCATTRGVIKIKI